MTIQDDVSLYLTRLISDKYVGIIIAPEKTTVEAFLIVLEGAGFTRLLSWPDVFKAIEVPTKKYLLLADFDSATLYSMVKQYPTGQINLFDAQTMKNIWLNPAYDKAALVMIATPAELKKSSQVGHDFLSVTGLAYQN